MQTVEITAKSVDEATKAAAEKLGVESSLLKVTVLEETKGLFGKSNVRVRAEVVEAAPAAPAAPTKLGRSSKKPAKAAVEPEPEAVATPEPVAAIQEAFEAPAPKKSRGGKKTKDAPEPAAPVAAEETESEAEVLATEADGERLAALLRELLEAASVTVNVRVGEIAGRYVNLIVDGKDAAFLVGKHGEVLNALQYLLNIISGRRAGNGIRATLDCNDYRRRREEALTGLATKIANEVRQRGEEAVLDALPAFERRIVHKALSELDGVTTYSEGEEPNRRVVIAPA